MSEDFKCTECGEDADLAIVYVDRNIVELCLKHARDILKATNIKKEVLSFISTKYNMDELFELLNIKRDVRKIE